LDKMVRREFVRKLEEIRSILLELLGNVEEMVNQLFASIESPNNLVEDSSKLDTKVRSRTKDLLDLCTEVVTLQQPMATDIRLIISSIRIITDIERSVRDSLHIVEIAPSLKTLSKYVKLFEDTKVVLLSMIDVLKESLKSNNSSILLELSEKDEIIDKFYDTMNNSIREDIKENPDNALELVDLMMAVRRIERIADHLCNIAEKIYYLQTAEIRRIA